MTNQRTEAIDNVKNTRLSLPGYCVVNAAINYNANKNWRFSLIAQNLTDNRYLNTNELAFRAKEVFNGAPQNPIRIILGINISL